MLTDPQGAVFGLLHRNEPTAARPMPPPSGTIVWNELLTSDAEAALKFYSALFGWEQMTRIDMGAKGAYLVFGADGVQMGGMMAAAIPGGPLWLPYTQVDDTDATVALAVKAGATLCLGPQTVPGGGRIANFIDPQGVMFAVHSMPPAETRPVAAKPAAKRSRATSAAAKKAAAAAPRRKRTKRSGVAKVAKKKRTRRAVRKPAHKAANRRRPPTPRKTSAKRRAVTKSLKRAAKSSARASAKRSARRAKRR
jgi:predicted enzyme related to lactoylglutathione lyase